MGLIKINNLPLTPIKSLKCIECPIFSLVFHAVHLSSWSTAFSKVPYNCWPVCNHLRNRTFRFILGFWGLFGCFHPTQDFSLIMSRTHYRWMAANVDLCSALTAIEQWGFFSVLWHGASVYNGHLWGLVTITPIAERLAVEAVITYFYVLDLS